MSKHKANYDKLMTITVFAAAISVRGIGVTINSSGQAAVPAAGTMPDVIFTEGDVPAGAAVQGAIPNGGIIPVLAGAAVAVGDDVTTDADGKFIPASSGNAIVGRAVTAATAADEFVGIQFTFKGAKA